MKKLSILLSIPLLCFFSCKNKDHSARPVPESVFPYVYAFTSGTISRTQDIKVRFAQDAVSSTQTGKEAQSQAITFRPNIKGQLIWENERTLRFTPTEHLNPSTVYVGHVNLKSIFSEAKGDASSFEFEFRTRDLGYTYTEKGFRNANKKDLRKQDFAGQIKTTDYAESNIVEQMVEAQQANQDLEISWTHDSNGTKHDFLIENITRADFPSQFDININAQALGLSEKHVYEVKIPALNDFMLVSAQAARGQQQFIELNFSDPLQKNQDLTGLIRINDYSGKIRFDIEGNVVTAFPESRISGSRQISVSPGIKNILGKKMSKTGSWDLTFEETKPGLRIVGDGAILPDSEGLLLAFEAVNLNAVEVEIFKIFSNNILQFLQNNNIQEPGYNSEAVGRVIAQEKVDLRELNTLPNRNNYVRYALDLNKIIDADPASIYQVRIGFRPSYTDYFCTENTETEKEELTIAESNNYQESGEFESIWGGYYGIEGYYSDYSYRDRENPCKGAYYNYEHFDRRNIIASNIGLIVKKGENKSVFAAVNNLKTTDPISGAEIEFFDFQQQSIKKVTTDGAGMVFTELSRSPAFVTASYKEQVAYLKVLDGNSLSLSRFDVSGAVTQKGLKGFIYGERGVWRPSDSLYLNFILEDKAEKLPVGHPINFTLYDPLGQVREERTVFENTAGIYALHCSTSADAPTGSWRAEVKVGGATFSKTIKIETVKPNRLKATFDFGSKALSPAQMPADVAVQANWLHGAPAKDSRVVVEMQVKPASMSFSKFKEFKFTDPARKFSASDREVNTIFDGKTNPQGQANFQLDISKGQKAPGKLRANFKTRIFEKGGDFSTVNSSVEYHPYQNYTGVRIPRNSWNSKRIPIDQSGKIEFVVTDNEGKPLSDKKLKIGIYRASWRWWWSRSQDNVSKFSSDSHMNALKKANLVSNKNGLASYTFTPKEWGRYLVRVCDEESGHCSGDFFYSGYPWNDENSNRDGATMLAFAAKKEKYTVGETVEINVPANEVSRVLISLETGSKVIRSFWREAKKGENTFKFETSPDMAPTVYAHVSLIQPHAQTENDLPMRMYGVVPINVEDPKTKLNPEFVMPDELRPEQKFSIKVSEKNDKPMAYTLAVVDDGLLDLTNFKTPNPHSSFYAREALGVQTFDLYDHVLGAYGGDLSRILSIGGDDVAEGEDSKKQANRFKPVVRHIGPFYLAAGQSTTHEIEMPNYVGSVRVMLVAANSDASYGKAEKTVPVKKPLMVLATLPRVLGPGETLRLPISVFAMDKKVKNVGIHVSENSGLVGISNEGKSTLRFDDIGEKMAYFDLKVGEKTGIAQFTINASGGGEKASQEIEIEVRNPNPIVTNVQNAVLQKGENWNAIADAVGVAGTNEAILEISNLPPLDLGRRMQYLVGYPYGCLEQTTSKAFPQLYVNRLLELNDYQKKTIPENINVALEKLADFHRGNGKFSYWRGSSEINEWANNYAGHFMLEAEKLGYTLPAGLKKAWIRGTKKQADTYANADWDYDYYYRNPQFTQAYRLYTLALANEPATGAMNRLREREDLTNMSRWYLAAAYALSGQTEAATQIIKKANTQVDKYRELGNTFGSQLRDKAIILEVLTLLDERDRATEILKEISTEMSNGGWCSTQEIAYALLAVGKYVGENNFSSSFKFAYKIDQEATKNTGSNNPLVNIPIAISGQSDKPIMVENKSEGVLFARLLTSGQPLTGDQTAAANKLEIAVNYTDNNGKVIAPNAIPQGTDFIAVVKVTHPGQGYAQRYDEMALNQIFPSGWEILNTRMDNLQQNDKVSHSDYQDIRDDRVYTFFDINHGNTHTYKVRLNAAYQGKYYLPTVSCEAMYDAGINARQPGQWVEVVAPDIL